MAEKITNLGQSLTQEKDALNTVLTKINQLCEHNKKLQGLIEIQKEVKELEKSHTRSLPWFKRLINTVSNIKYVFVKSEEQLTQESTRQNDDLLKRIDNTILSIADKSAPLKQLLQQEIRKHFNDLAKKDLSQNQRDRLTALFNNEYAAKPEKVAPLTVTKPLHFSNGEKLEDQLNILNTTKQNIQNLLTENSNIKELKEIQKQVAEIRAEIPYGFFEKLNNNWQKIKNIFINNSEQVLAKNKESNTKAITKIDKKLYEADHKFKELTNNKKQNIDKIISKLPENKKLQEIMNRHANHIISRNEIVAEPLENNAPPVPNQNTNNVTPIADQNTFAPPPPPPLPKDNVPPPVPNQNTNNVASIAELNTFTPPPPPMPKALETIEIKKSDNQPRPAVNTSDLLKQIHGEIKLNKVELDPKTGKPINEHPGSRLPTDDSENTYNPIAEILKRRVAVEISDSERSNSESGSEWASDASNNKLKVQKTRDERDTKHVQRVLSGRSKINYHAK